MSTVYLHIGMPKTGTTAIQNFLWNNQAALEKHRACYPELGMKYVRVSKLRNAHFLVDHLIDSRPAGADYVSILDQIAKLGEQYDTILLSDESIWEIKSKQPMFWEKLKQDLEIRGLALRVVVYLRRQDGFAQSVYRQKIKGSYTDLPFDAYLERLREIYSLDYFPCIEMLVKTLGRDSLILHVYEKEQYGGNLFADFLAVAGIPLDEDFNTDKLVYNVSLDGPRLELQRILNSLSENPFDTKILYDSMHSLQMESPPAASRESLFHPEDRLRFVDEFSESNSRIAREFLGREDGVLFREGCKDELQEFHVSTEELLHSTILFYGKTVQRLEKDAVRLQKHIKELEKELAEVRENTILFRLKRKLRHFKKNVYQLFSHGEKDAAD